MIADELRHTTPLTSFRVFTDARRGLVTSTEFGIHSKGYSPDYHNRKTHKRNICTCTLTVVRQSDISIIGRIPKRAFSVQMPPSILCILLLAKAFINHLNSTTSFTCKH
jgi:hypothetical protein